jgi:hypothetical protein
MPFQLVLRKGEEDENAPNIIGMDFMDENV